MWCWFMNNYSLGRGNVRAETLTLLPVIKYFIVSDTVLIWNSVYY